MSTAGFGSRKTGANMLKPPASAIKLRRLARLTLATIPHMQWLLITGLPGTGKSTLGRRLALRYRVPLLSKDLIKEPLLNVLDAQSAAHSRLLSDASFAALFAVARELLAA